MDEARDPGTDAASAEKTRAGNYFVANYPPFSFWKKEHLPELTRALQRPPAPQTDLGLYVHIPFCRKRCHFCYFKVYTDKDSASIRSYLDAVIEEPPGGAHASHDAIADALGAALRSHLGDLIDIEPAELVRARAAKFRAMGPYLEG